MLQNVIHIFTIFIKCMSYILCDSPPLFSLLYLEVCMYSILICLTKSICGCSAISGVSVWLSSPLLLCINEHFPLTLGQPDCLSLVLIRFYICLSYLHFISLFIIKFDFLTFFSEGNLDLRRAEIINPNHPEVISFNER